MLCQSVGHLVKRICLQDLLIYRFNDLKQVVILRQWCESEYIICCKVLMSAQCTAGCLKAYISEPQERINDVVLGQEL